MYLYDINAILEWCHLYSYEKNFWEEIYVYEINVKNLLFNRKKKLEHELKYL